MSGCGNWFWACYSLDNQRAALQICPQQLIQEIQNKSMALRDKRIQVKKALPTKPSPAEPPEPHRSLYSMQIVADLMKVAEGEKRHIGQADAIFQASKVNEETKITFSDWHKLPCSPSAI